jgi:hypothetical protein
MDQREPTLREALAQHRADHGFPPDGGNAQRWVLLRVGPIPFRIPNLEIRRKAMVPHDCNHVVSGYGHDLVGELEIAAWEIGGGCGRYAAAWVLAWSAFVPGVVTAPHRMLEAFARGRRTQNLFNADLDRLLDRPVSEVRAALGLDQSSSRRRGDLARFAVTSALAPVVAVVPLVVWLATSPLWLWERARGAARRGPGDDTCRRRCRRDRRGDPVREPPRRQEGVGSLPTP